MFDKKKQFRLILKQGLLWTLKTITMKPTVVWVISDLAKKIDKNNLNSQKGIIATKFQTSIWSSAVKPENHGPKLIIYGTDWQLRVENFKDFM